MSPSSRKKVTAVPDPKANSASAARGDEATILQAIRSLREDLLKKIDDNAEMQSKELRREISQLRDELRSAIDRVSSRTKALEDRVESLDSANDHSDLITTLERDVQQLKKDMKIFSDRSEDLEARSRRCNLRITGIQEKREAGKNPTDFVAKLLQESLGLEKESLLDSCHRTPTGSASGGPATPCLCGEMSLLPGEGSDPPQGSHGHRSDNVTRRQDQSIPRLHPSSREAESRL
ncbi:uncharacterized protein isoform X2 [Notothenia coriiceps]|uniref:Uncharacterized protein LOC104949116 isoform X1 n=1 Tax=Notothenia coriiceps TaxID=8208 RepID=A0A6I9N6X6_9TELE|nr:PREDICTED: uncharacterized protein LOC104949116 isoform X1 [Notothenia coriiceps]XP_010773699.1 PREDICTED: uncharacterized protein LOC104949116 isoform X2 [Notothenia coriiceps]